MYSLVIAEDELTTRWGLVNMVKWNELGFQVDGEFSDGQEVLAYLESHQPDVILTDIKMNHELFIVFLSVEHGVLAGFLCI